MTNSPTTETQRRKILFLTHRVPYPPNRGDRIRSYHMLRYLCELGDVWLAALTDEPTSNDTITHLNLLCENIAIVPLGRRSRWARAAMSFAAGKTATAGLFASPRLQTIVTNWAAQRRFDACVVFCSGMGQFIEDVNLADVRTVVDLVDVDSEKWFDYAQDSRGLKSWLYRREAQRVRRLEISLARQAKAVTVVSEPEADLLRSFCDTDNIHAVGNGVDTQYFQPPTTTQTTAARQCVFVGVLDYPPNVDGLRWFCREVWPQVRRSLPRATFNIVGRSPNAAVKALGQVDGVQVIGEVPDVRDALARATIAIAPLRIARGVQNKVLEAMAAGTPVIASPQALTGIDLTPGVDALRADDPTAWHDQLVRLLTDRELQAELSINGRTFVEEQHSWSQKLSTLDELLGIKASDARIDDRQLASLAAS